MVGTESQGLGAAGVLHGVSFWLRATGVLLGVLLAVIVGLRGGGGSGAGGGYGAGDDDIPWEVRAVLLISRCVFSAVAVDSRGSVSSCAYLRVSPRVSCLVSHIYMSTVVDTAAAAACVSNLLSLFTLLLLCML